MDENPSDPEQQMYDRGAAIIATLIVAACFASVGYCLQVAKGHTKVAQSACADRSSAFGVYKACLESFGFSAPPRF
jgi:hypothetical protein